MTPSASDVRRFVEAIQGGHELVSYDEGVLELEWGWRVMLQSRRWVASREFQDMLIGHGPTYVSRAGRVFLTGSGKPPEFYEEGLAWELSGNHGLWERAKMRLKGWRLDDYLQELTRAEIRSRLTGDSWAADLYLRWTETE